MAEFNLAPGSQQYGGFPTAQQPASNVDWYTAPGYTGNYSYDQASTSGAAYGTFEDEPPLLEELGIDISAILSRTRSILTFRLGGRDVDSMDLGGPLVYMTLLGFAHLLVGKLHFGYILGWIVVGSVLLWFVLGSMAGSDPESKLDIYSCCCILGYSLLPLVIHACLSILLPGRSMISMGIAGVAVTWSSITAAKLFLHRSPALRGQMSIVVYPCTLMYAAFALLTLY